MLRLLFLWTSLFVRSPFLFGLERWRPSSEALCLFVYACPLDRVIFVSWRGMERARQWRRPILARRWNRHKVDVGLRRAWGARGVGVGRGGVWVGSSSRGSLDGGARRHRPICFHFRRMNDSDSSWLRLTARPATTRTVDPPPPSSHPTLPPAGRSFDFFFVFVTAFYPVSTIGYFC